MLYLSKNTEHKVKNAFANFIIKFTSEKKKILKGKKKGDRKGVLQMKNF